MTSEAEAPAKKSKKRKGDEIDQLFEEKLGKKIKKAGLAADVPPAQPVAAAPKEQPKEERKKKRKEIDGAGKDKDLAAVLGAIKAAPKDEKSHKRKKKAV